MDRTGQQFMVQNVNTENIELDFNHKANASNYLAA